MLATGYCGGLLPPNIDLKMTETITNPATTRKPMGTIPRLYKMMPTTAPITTEIPGLIPIAAQKPKVITPITVDVAASVESSIGT